MMHITVKLQSIIDVITNSSTELYVAINDNTVSLIKEILQFCIPKGEKVEDYFSVRLRSKTYQDKLEWFGTDEGISEDLYVSQWLEDEEGSADIYIEILNLSDDKDNDELTQKFEKLINTLEIKEYLC